MEQIETITAIHHPVRRRIVDYLFLHGKTQVGTLARALTQQVGSISHHLRMLERASVVTRVEAPDGDKRSSWWQLAREKFTWSSNDFAERPSDLMLAREAERLNVAAQLRRLEAWKKSAHQHPEWDGFTTDALAWATPAELSALSAALSATLDRWRSSIDSHDGQERSPVFFFAHGFPTIP
ncbi:ArsR/SmtB family transcription factor [Paramicrobacterium agarici]|uniref:ArsR/SmtB family transcription factor n=1 Tax=Paramicrobacterium agarici TaxID=630514 RepID=UPI00114D6823|nr:winged helix-turn-helix domain-containing protein [Microbacterium agarici]TQO24172.1 DNA-binding transcriptional ArsR family regulator [Microbacterium agarici]